MSHPLLNIQGVSKYYTARSERITALENVSLSIDSNAPKIVALAGESGSGKSTLANMVLGFNQPDKGSIQFNGQELSSKTSAELRQYRCDVQAVFQDPFGVFNPFYRVRHVFDLVFRNFAQNFPKQSRPELIENALNSVGLQGGDILQKYPHQLSGGQRQRIMMARACLMQPRLIVADEPVSMVDASLRASILDVMMKLRDQQGIAFLYITHDLATAFQVCDEILLLYQGRLMEYGHPEDVIGNPKHPYAKLLVNSIPGIRYSEEWIKAPIHSVADTPEQTNVGCCFAPRCELAQRRCTEQAPVLQSFASRVEKSDSTTRFVACHFHNQL